MTVIIAIPLLAIPVCFALMAPVLYRLLQPCRAEEITPDWLERFSPSTYYSMRALLAHDDFRFLASQPGFDLSLYRKLRRERMGIFRQYLRCLISDFNRLHALARLLLAQSQDDHSEMVAKLFRLRVRFSVSVLQAEFSYFLCYLGFHTLAIQKSIAALEEMSAEIGHLGAVRVGA